jgi:hypothetical protein
MCAGVEKTNRTAENAKADLQAGIVPITANEYETALAVAARRALDWLICTALASHCQTRAERASERRDPHYSRGVGVPRFAA